MNCKNILVICTGGTIGMVCDKLSGALRPASMHDFEHILPELSDTATTATVVAFQPLIDSANVSPSAWSRMANVIYKEYEKYDGFVLLHGTDTMAYSASALSFMLENLQKPVIFTGSQLPLGVRRTDARENILTALEIAAAEDAEGKAIVPEVCIFFENTLYRGNRTTKRNAEQFDAFRSFNFSPLAQAGVHITYYPHRVHYPDWSSPMRLRTRIDEHVAILKLFPGISPETVRAILGIAGLRGVVLESYGTGNAPTAQWFVDALEEAIDKGIIIVNRTQCAQGAVEMGRYETSLPLLQAGVLSGYDITTEALVTKMMYLMGEHGNDNDTIKHLLQTDLCGEMTIS